MQKFGYTLAVGGEKPSIGRDWAARTLHIKHACLPKVVERTTIQSLNL
jgi:hypothetical protein